MINGRLTEFHLCTLTHAYMLEKTMVTQWNQEGYITPNLTKEQNFRTL